MLLQQRDNFSPAFLTTLLSALLTTLLSALFTTFLTTSGFCLGVFSRSPAFNRFSGGKEHGDTSVQHRGGGKQERRGHYYNAGRMGGQDGQEVHYRPPGADCALVDPDRDPHTDADR